MDWLLKRLADRLSCPAVVWDQEVLTYSSLLAKVRTWAAQLEEWGDPAGEGCAIIGDSSPHALALLLALLGRRQVAVPLCSLAPAAHERCLQIAQVGRIVILRGSDGWTTFRREPEDDPPLLQQLRSQGSGGLILFSSGSTGEPKASVWAADPLIERHRQPRPGSRALAFLRFDHIGGLNTLFHGLASGGTLVHVPQRDPDSVCRAIERYRVQLLPTTPTFLTMLLLARGHERFDLSSLELITYGTEPMPASTLIPLAAALPKVRFKQTYGLSEIGILPTQSRGRDSLWLRVGGPGFETKVVDGVLWVRARSAMLGYLNAPSPFDADGWLNTQDAVEVDGDYLRILGRTTELINVGGEKVYPAEVENVILQVENVAQAAVYGKPNPVTGQVVAAEVTLVRPEDPSSVLQRIRAVCRERLAPYQVPMFLKVSAEPRHGERFKIIRRRESA